MPRNVRAEFDLMMAELEKREYPADDLQLQLYLTQLAAGRWRRKEAE